jgi:hypothetical protein
VAVVSAIPFVERNDWLGWVAFLVVVTAVVGILGIQLLYVARMITDWRSGRDLD